MVGDFLEGFVCRCEDGVVCLCAVEDFNEVVVFVDELCKSCGILALVDELQVVSVSVGVLKVV